MIDPRATQTDIKANKYLQERITFRGGCSLHGKTSLNRDMTRRKEKRDKEWKRKRQTVLIKVISGERKKEFPSQPLFSFSLSSPPRRKSVISRSEKIREQFLHTREERKKKESLFSSFARAIFPFISFLPPLISSRKTRRKRTRY